VTFSATTTPPLDTFQRRPDPFAFVAGTGFIC